MATHSVNPPKGGAQISSSKPKVLHEPVSKRDLTTREKIILLEGSKLHGHIFPPWKAAPQESEFELTDCSTYYEDDVEFPLSALQKDVFDGWQRPHEIVHSQDAIRQSLAKTTGVHDLVQDVITDCSVVASLCAVTARTERGHEDILMSCCFPQINNDGEPATSKNGKLIFRFHFNGCYRRVVIDDRLPRSRTSRALHVVDRNSPDVLWPALVEKAYLKVRGGYDFPGSNSGTDLWVLTGWVPEQLFLQSDDMDRNALWKRVLNAFKFGDVLVTMGTGKLTESEEQGLGLVGEHDYSVTDLKECNGQQLFLIKNPWANGQVWRGPVLQHYESDNMHESLEALHIEDNDSLKSHGTRSLTPGSFWMPLNDVFQCFESIYLNWNPGLFSHREDIHFQWDLSVTRNPLGFLGFNPQYSITGGASGVLWLLLSRHFTASARTATGANQDHTEQDDSDRGFISLYVFKNGGQRVMIGDGALMHGPYVDSPNSLLKVDVAPNEALTVVVSQQTLPPRSHAFTLSAFSLSATQLNKATERFPHSSTHHGSWSSGTSGGNAGSPDYQLNPQFCITVPRRCDVSLLLLNETECWPLHVKLIWANGKQVRTVTTRDIVSDSGEHRNGYALAESRDVRAGTYTIVCSTFEQGQHGKFVLQVDSTVTCPVSRIAVASAGRFVTDIRSNTWSPGYTRLLAPLTTFRLNRISLRANIVNSSTQHHCAPLKISIEIGQGPTKQLIAVSGNDDFRDARGVGVVTPETDIAAPGSGIGRGLWIALERPTVSGSMYIDSVDIQILSTAPVEVGPWSLAND